MKSIRINKAILTYLIFLLFFGIFYLLSKHSVPNDSSISEWLINYNGGFTRRGLGGEISIYISNLLNISLREAIFTLQSILLITYVFLIYNYIKNLKLNTLQIFAFFTPIFLLYPVAEIEVLGRKEIILFIFFISLLFFINLKNNKTAELFVFFILPLVCLIWEEVVLFCPYIATIFIIKRNLKNFWQSFKYLFIIFLPSILTFIFIFLFPLSLEGHNEMSKFLETQFGETCYMSCSLLVTSTIYFDTHTWVHANAHLEHYARYIWIFVVGFMPLNILVFNSDFIKKKNFITKNIKLRNLFFLLYSPSILLFIFAYDWGRWINITYTFSILLYLFLLKNNLITNDFKNFFKKHKEFLGNRILVSLLFFIFAFGWNPKTVVTGDIGSFPWYRIPYKAIEVFDYKFKSSFFKQE